MELKMKVERTADHYDCDEAGCSGGYSEGADVYLGDKLIYQFVPVAHCFGGCHMTNEDLIKGIVEGVLKEVANIDCNMVVEETYG